MLATLGRGIQDYTFVQPKPFGLSRGLPSMPSKPRNLILASTATWRAELLRELQVPFDVMAPPYVEQFPGKASPRELALTHSEGKVQAAAQKRPNAYILAADQTAEFDKRCLQKPRNLDTCIAQLTELQGNAHHLHSAISLYNPEDSSVQSEVVTVTLEMRALSPSEVREYIHRDQPIGCVGSYKFELTGRALFKSVDQDESAIVGLPLKQVSRLLFIAGLLEPPATKT